MNLAAALGFGILKTASGLGRMAARALFGAVLAMSLAACERTPEPEPAAVVDLDRAPELEPAAVVDLDRAALTALYHAANGDEWTNSDNWLTAAPVEEWSGVRVDEGGFISLHLRDNGLRGEIPTELANLSNLRALNLSDNNLSGEIPILGRLRQGGVAGQSHLIDFGISNAVKYH